MRSCSLILRGGAVLLAVACCATALAQTDPPVAGAPPAVAGPSGGREITDEATLNEVLEVCEGLDAGLRARHFAKRAFALLRKQGAAADEAGFKEINDLLDAITYGRDSAQRIEKTLTLGERLHALRLRVLQLIPPVCAFDAANDDGNAVIVMWRPVPGAVGYVLKGREFGSAKGDDKEFRELKRFDGKAYAEPKPLKIYPGRRYQFALSALQADGAETVVGETQQVKARRSWFSWNKRYYLAFLTVLCGAVVYYIWLAQRGVSLKIRKIAGLEAIDEAVGRATEMGRPVLFIAGIQDMDNIQTVAGLTVLGRVARTAAEHDAMLEVPTSRSLVMTAARETVHSAFMNAGRADAYNEKKIYYVTDEQFGFVAATTGLIVREKPAACIYMGAFFAESLILAETANTVGSIQIAGTAESAQLPFFVAACDYTLIGEEFFAASAYLSGEPRQLGSLKGQDVGKAIVMLFTLFGTVVLTLAVLMQAENSILGDIVDFIRTSVLRVSD